MDILAIDEIEERVASQIAALKNVLAEQTQEIAHKAAEAERLREVEKAKAVEIARSNELSERSKAVIDTLLLDVRTTIQLLVYMVDPILRRQDSQVSLVLGFVKLMVHREMKAAGNAAVRRAFSNLGKQIDNLPVIAFDSSRQDKVRRLVVLRSNLTELKMQKAKHGLRQPLDLINDIKQVEADIEALEQELV